MTTSAPEDALDQVREYLMQLQDEICETLTREDGSARFEADELPGERGGLARPRVMSDGALFERAAVNFSHTGGQQLPPAATAARPELTGRAFAAVSISLILHPRNPYVPTAHANFRFFKADAPGQAPVWWFGGGFDLTPYYGFEQDAVHWHHTAREACEVLDRQAYPRFKRWCDEYFYLKHRDEPRGVGGIFFDDLCEPDFERCFQFVRSAGDRFLTAYVPIARRRRDTPYGEREREFQLMRRGRYVEFNLIYDRGTLYGLQAGGRVESILASLPPLVRWRYTYRPEAGSEEARLYRDFLRPREWLEES